MLNTAAFEIKNEAMKTLHCIAYSCGKAYLPFVEKTLQTVIEVIGNKSKDIRESALKTVNSLLMACDTEDKMAAVFNHSIPSIIKELEQANVCENDE